MLLARLIPPLPPLPRVWPCSLGALGYWEGQEAQGVRVRVRACERQGWEVWGVARRGAPCEQTLCHRSRSAGVRGQGPSLLDGCG